MFWTVKARLVALFVLCLVVAAVTAQAQANPAAQIAGLDCSKVTFTTVTCAFTTNVPTQSSVATGTTKQVLVPTPDLRYRTRHSITVRGLMPNTRYLAVISATPKKGKLIRVGRLFQTAAPGSTPATVTSNGNKLLLNGQPFFPIMVRAFSPCPEAQTVVGTVSLGANIFEAFDSVLNCIGVGQDPAQWGQSLHLALGNKLWWFEHNTAARQHLQDQGLPELINWQATSLFADIAGNEDLCKSSRQLYEQMSKASKSKALLFMTPLAAFPGRPGEKWCLTAQALNRIYWTTVIAGLRGIEYITTDAGNGPDFDVPSDRVNQAAKLADQMATLGPALLTGKPLGVKSGVKSQVKVGAWQYVGTTYVIAVNTDDSAITGTFTVPNNAAREAQVFWEGRNVKVKRGSISDRFTAQAVHIYRLTAPKKK